MELKDHPLTLVGGSRVRAQVGPRTLLVASRCSLASAEASLRAAGQAGALVGCLLDEADAHSPMDATVAVLGSTDWLGDVVRDRLVERVLMCLPCERRGAMRSVVRQCEAAGVAWRYLPTMEDQLAGRVEHRAPTRRRIGGDGHMAREHSTLSAPQPPLTGSDLTRLIDRPPRPLDERLIRRRIEGRVVLITGAGGSIGSELARRVCEFHPAKLVLVERGENALFEIDRELAATHPDQSRAAVLHDVTCPRRTLDVLNEHRPAVVFHAAAHKHVPMMEDHPAQAVENNLYGTRSVADAAHAAGVERFVMISTDKAVNPSSIMGASKRLAELYIQHLNRTSRTMFCMVRFGNVLGSACSVLPIWERQLAAGGPLTVTDPAMRRYFMTIPEAAGLVLQAGSLAGAEGGEGGHEGGEVFLLDMGEPVRVLDLALRFLSLRGHGAAEAKIRFIGARPGEKLFEELAYVGEDMLPTVHGGIRIWRTTPPGEQHMRTVLATFDRLRERSGDGVAWRGVSRESVAAALRAAVPEMVAAAAAA